jgi:NAD(P) transhydrogenase subunit alpha
MVGGFVVTDRMLQMFTRRKPKKAPAETPTGAGSAAGGAA